MANDSETSPILTPGEAAQLLHVHVNTVRRWSNQGVIKSYHINPRGDRRFIREDVTHLLNELHKNRGDVKKARLTPLLDKVTI